MRMIFKAISGLLLLVSLATAGNRFPVLTYSDDSRINNLDSFYQWLDEWGASEFYGVTDSISKYVTLKDYAINIAGGHFAVNQRIWLDSLKQMELCLAPRNLVTSFGWDAINTEARFGYKPGQTLVGTNSLDQDIGRNVRKALVNSHNQGLIHAKFAYATVFRKVPKRTKENSCTFEVKLRLPDLSGNPSTAVAQMRFGYDDSTPPLATRTITVGDFNNTTTYHRFQLPITVKGSHAVYKYEVYWYDTKDIYLDSLRVFDAKGLLFDAIMRDSTVAARQRIDQYYSLHNDESNAVKKLYVVDEPTGAEFPQYEALNGLFAGLSTPTPKGQMTTLGAYVHGGPESDPTWHSYFDAFYEFSQQPYMLYDDYRNWCYVNSATDGVWDTTNFQFQMSTAFIPHLQIARQRALAQDPPKDFHVTIPTYAGYDSVGYDGQGIFKKTRRLPTDGETWTMVNLALLYGAKGIGYWEYVGRDGTDHLIAGKAHLESNGAEPEPELQEQVSQEIQTAPPGYGSAPVSCYACSTVYRSQLPYIFKGMFKIVDGSAVREPLWYTTKSINHYLDSMAYFFLNAQLQGTSPNATNLSGVAGSFIDSIKSLSGYSQPFIETGFFTYQGQNYAFILNRRADNGTCAQLDTQTVRIFMPSKGIYEVSDLYQDESGQMVELKDTVWDSCGVITWDRHLAPGKAMLVKRKGIKEYWSGTLAADEIWPRFSTIRLTGDLTIPLGKTLTIRSCRIEPLANTDSLSQGYNTSKTELVVGGTLRLEGTNTERILFQPNQSLDSSWYGVRVNYGGKLVADNVIIKKAYTGLYLNGTADTVKNSRIEDCFMHGVYSEGRPFLLDHDTLISHNTDVSEDSIVYGMRYGVRVLGDDNTTGPTITNSYFTNEKYPIELFWCRSKVTNTTIRRSGLYQSLGKGTPAINLGRYANVDSIYNCSIQNYKYGVKAGGSRSNSLVQRCEIGSDLFRDVQHPYMYIGVHADSGYLANCKLRSNCFKGVEQHHIFRRWTLVDAGTASNFGHNNFFVDTVRVHPPCTIPVTMDTIPDSVATCAFYRYPEVVIYNVSGAAVDARGNYWAEFYYYPRKTGGNTLADNIYGPVDTLSPYIVPDLFCESGPPPDIKVVVDSADEDPKSGFAVEQNYPNPFNPTTEIRFTLPRAEHVTIEVFNVLGQRIAVLADGDLPSGDHMVRWDGEDDSGERVASGIYLYRVVAGENRITKKMLMLK